MRFSFLPRNCLQGGWHRALRGGGGFVWQCQRNEGGLHCAPEAWWEHGCRNKGENGVKLMHRLSVISAPGCKESNLSSPNKIASFLLFNRWAKLLSTLKRPTAWQMSLSLRCQLWFLCCIMMKQTRTKTRYLWPGILLSVSLYVPGILYHASFKHANTLNAELTYEHKLCFSFIGV